MAARMLDQHQTVGRRYSLTALSRAITLLERISESRQPIGVSALARSTSIPKSSAFRLLELLTQHDLVERRERGYLVGETMRRLAGLAQPQLPYDMNNLLMPYLVELYERTADAISLGVLDGNDMVLMFNIRGRQHQGLPVPRERTPAHCSAIGKLLLAYRTQSTDWHPGTLTPCTPYTVTNPAELARQFRKIRQSGVAVAGEEQVAGLVDIAMPVTVEGRVFAGIARSRPRAVPGDPTADATQRQIAFAASAAIGRHLPG
jgi:DNA-binding IclR family transcriptional regulator